VEMIALNMERQPDNTVATISCGVWRPPLRNRPISAEIIGLGCGLSKSVLVMFTLYR
jgi:hypothetical protein